MDQKKTKNAKRSVTQVTSDKAKLPVIRLVLFWGLVATPLVWGIVQTVHKAMKLFE